MSTLSVANISDGTTTVAASYVTNGSAKAWVNFNGTGTIAIRDSFNVSSLTDNGTGNYIVNLTSAFSAADYAGYGSNNIGTDAGLLCAPSSSSAFLILTYDAGSLTDNTTCTSANFGDLA